MIVLHLCSMALDRVESILDHNVILCMGAGIGSDSCMGTAVSSLGDRIDIRMDTLANSVDVPCLWG